MEDEHVVCYPECDSRGLDRRMTLLTQEQLGIVEILEEFAEENVSISSYCFLNAIEYARKVVSGPVLELNGEAYQTSSEPATEDAVP